MKARVIGAAITGVLLLPGAASAQGQFGAATGAAPFVSTSPQPPAQPPAAVPVPAPPPPPAGQDIFQADAWTYQPSFDVPTRRHFRRRRFFPRGLGYLGPLYVPSSPWPAPVSEPEAREESAPDGYSRPEVQPGLPRPYVPGPPGPPKTLYVIRGCYAGDVPPRLDELPNGCDAADLRTIAPR